MPRSGSRVRVPFPAPFLFTLKKGGIAKLAKARVCKTLIPGSSPGAASIFYFAGVAELVDARDLKSLGAMHRAGSIPAPGTTLQSI